MSLFAAIGRYGRYGYASLEEELANRLGTGTLQFYPAGSGRVALHHLAKHLRPRLKSGKALIPDYLCNVVPQALEEAGLSVQTYPLDSNFEGDPVLIRNLISDQKIGLLLTASLFGSSASLVDLDNPEMRAFLLAHQVFTVVDLCQDLTLRRFLPAGYGDQLAAVLSFNNKSIPGMMGGGVLSTFAIPDMPLSPSLAQRIALLGEYRAARAFRLRQRLPTLGRDFEYSFCREFPYTLAPYRLTRLQLMIALFELDRLVQRNRHRQSTLSENRACFREMPFGDTSPYLIGAGNPAALPADLPRKKSYALPDQPQESLRPDLLIFHNFGEPR